MNKDISAYIKALKLISQVNCEAIDASEISTMKICINNWTFNRYIRFKGDQYPTIRKFKIINNRQIPILSIIQKESFTR